MRALLAALIGMLAGGLINVSASEQGADTPAFALLGGALALGIVLLWARRRRAGASQED